MADNTTGDDSPLGPSWLLEAFSRRNDSNSNDNNHDGNSSGNSNGSNKNSNGNSISGLAVSGSNNNNEPWFHYDDEADSNGFHLFSFLDEATDGDATLEV